MWLILYDLYYVLGYPVAAASFSVTSAAALSAIGSELLAAASLSVSRC